MNQTSTTPGGAEPDPQGSHKARQVELLISSLLRVGVTVSLVVVVAGLALSFHHHPNYFRAKDALKEVTATNHEFPHTISATLAGLKTSRGQSVVMLGLLLLIATPVMRVAVSILAFVYEKDLTFIAITTLVLALLIVSFLLGRAER